MKLKDFMNDNFWTVKDLKEILDCSLSHAYDLYRGKRPSFKMIMRIEQITNGKVTVDDFRD